MTIAALGHDFQNNPETLSTSFTYEIEQVSICIVPIWFMHCTWNGQEFLYATHGATGECAGNLPVDGKRRAFFISRPFVIAAAAIALISLLSKNAAIFFATMFFYPLFWLVVIIVAIIIFMLDRLRMRMMNTASETTNADANHDDASFTVIERRIGNPSHRKSDAYQKD